MIYNAKKTKFLPRSNRLMDSVVATTKTNQGYEWH